MLSDDSSTDSESGRFKSHAKSERKESKPASRPSRGAELLPDLARNRTGNRYSGRDFERRHEDRGQFGRRRSRDRFDPFRRHSPPRRRFSRDKSPVARRSPERHRNTREGEHSRPRETRENKEERDSNVKKLENKQNDIRRSASPKRQHESKRNFREEIRKNIVVNVSKKKIEERSKPEERRKLGRDKHREYSTKSSQRDISSEVHASVEIIPSKNRSRSPVQETSVSVENEVSRSKIKRYSDIKDVSDTEHGDLELPASYYNLVPATDDVVHDAETIHSVTDSSEDEEKLRARLLNLEKELDKSKKKKSKKSKKKSKSKHKDRDSAVEVSSTTDVQDTSSIVKSGSDTHMQTAEVSSTQHRSRKDSSEEGEISTDNESANISIDPSDLRHRLKRSTVAPDTSGSPDLREKLKQKSDVMGPALPPHMVKSSGNSSSPEMEGPPLSQHLHDDRNMGPTIPSDMRKILAQSTHDQTEDYHASSDEEGIGPLPAGHEEKWSAAHKKLEERALNMKIRSLEGGSSTSDVKGREEWMLELPEAKAKHLGLGPRQFRSREAPDMSDRSSWTDTPHEKELKAAGLAPAEEASTAVLQRDAHQRHIEDRDRHQEKAAKKHKKKHKREESLLEMHEKKLKKKKKKEEREEGGKVRRPFDRDVDLQANRFDEAQKKAIIKKAQNLDSRFSRGEAKYL